MGWKKLSHDEDVKYMFENDSIKGEVVIASLVTDTGYPDAEIRVLYGEDERLTVRVSRSVADKMSEKEFLRIVELHLKRHGVKV